MGLALLLGLAACSPYASLIAALIPDGTLPTLFNNLKGVDADNQRRVNELAAKGDWQGLAAFAQANIAKDRTNADWWFIAGVAYGQLGQYPTAIDHLSEAVRLSPDDVDARNMLALALRLDGKPDRAARNLHEVLLFRQDIPFTYYLLGECYRDLNQPDRAVQAYQRALGLNPSYPDAVYGLGLAYLAQGRNAEYQAAVSRLQPMNPQLASQLAAAGRKR